MPVKELARRLVEAALKLDSRQRDTLLTAFVLSGDDLDLVRRCLDLIDAGRGRVDSRLILALYEAGDDRMKVGLMSSGLVSRMPPRLFRRLFADVRSRLGPRDIRRQELAWFLNGFLHRHPKEIQRFEPEILDLLRNSRPELRGQGLLLAGKLSRLEDRDLAIVKRCLRAQAFILNGLNLLHQWTEQFEALSAELQTFLESRELKALATDLGRTASDEHVRHNARCLLKGLRQRRS